MFYSRIPEAMRQVDLPSVFWSPAGCLRQIVKPRAHAFHDSDTLHKHVKAWEAG